MTAPISRRVDQFTGHRAPTGESAHFCNSGDTDALRDERDELRIRVAEMQADRDELWRTNQELTAEIRRLKAHP